MLTKTHTLGGSYDPCTKVESFQLAKLKLHWYVQSVAGNPPAGEALDTGHSGSSAPSLSLLTTSRISVSLPSSGQVHVAHVSSWACSGTAAPPSHGLGGIWKGRATCVPAPWSAFPPVLQILTLCLHELWRLLRQSQPFWMSSMVWRKGSLWGARGRFHSVESTSIPLRMSSSIGYVMPRVRVCSLMQTCNWSCTWKSLEWSILRVIYQEILSQVH